jgi:L-ascorbate metabolism protein UlaG (beta-lactamase superfamily)
MSIKLTWFGTACFLIEYRGTRLLFDPFFLRNERAFPLLSTKKDELGDVDGIFITHGHFDHMADAGYFLENYKTKLYCSERVSETIKNLINNEMFPSLLYSLSKENLDNIKVINAFESIKINNEIFVESIKSEHIRFDTRTILSRLFSLRFLKEINSLLPYNRYFPKGEVYGFHSKLGNKRIVSFGSLCDKYPRILNYYRGCDVFLIPLAGNSTKNLTKKGLNMVRALNPKMIIPIHWDNFFPPLSKSENINPFVKEIKKNFPRIEVRTLEIDEFIII